MQAHAKPAVAYPPQWLVLVLLASSSSRALEASSSCTPHWVVGTSVNDLPATATMLPAIVTLDGVQIGHPVETATGGSAICDQVASIDVSDRVVRGVSARIESGYYVPIIGKAGELIEFRYWKATEGKEYVSEYRYTMQDNGQIGSLAPGGAFELVLSP